MKYSPFLLSLLLMASACYSEPEFPVEPEISFENVRFIDMPSGQPDTLLVTVSFQDGNGDLGLRGTEDTPPYHLYDYVFKPDGTYLKIGEFDTLPAYTCNKYRIGTITGGVFLLDQLNGRDTVYVKPNRFYYNYFADLYRIRNGQEILVDYAAESGSSCGESLNGRLPISMFSSNGSAISGTITRSFGSRGWLVSFANDSLKIKVRIADRDLNLSNVAESPVFTLRGVQVQR
ncbi:hypothetical protein [Cesiribacter andamanensis]|uniref:Lipoprotein n=1 Tax=Cesiribacter andamanensis AMV16 TaxID=1279009 RepID=M7N2U0_9BACT|nr:hypothetical protein [Cesiribacter andamanensis]EMR01612.1 hypothetical protein ADICEAN_03265 [Cesiribacter andamanensis AMV16]